MNEDRSNENPFISLPRFRLPHAYPWRVGLVDAMRRGLKSCGFEEKNYRPPRFTGFYFNPSGPMGVCVDGRMHIPLRRPIAYPVAQVQSIGCGRYFIEAIPGSPHPAYLLIHDGWSGECWLIEFFAGLRFLTNRDWRLDDEHGTP